MSNLSIGDSFGANLLELVGIIGPRPKCDSEVTDPKRTARVIRLLLFIGFLTLLASGVLVISSDKIGFVSFLWSGVAATCALLAGGLMGILFGLPPPRRALIVRQAASPASTLTAGTTDGLGAKPAAAGAGDAGAASNPVALTASIDTEDEESGYVESTSLEQIADWLTKIIIGLTLTQYSSWEQKYFDLSRSVTRAIGFSNEQCATGNAGRDCLATQAIPGGMLMAIFALTGFIVAYFWMRRYFIFEMVTARKEEREKYKKRQERARIDADPVLQAQAKAQEDTIKAKAEADAKVLAVQAETDAKIAAAKADADARIALANAEAEAFKAEAEAAKAIAVSEAAKAVANSNFEAQKTLADQESLLKAAAAIAEGSPDRSVATGENLQEIIAATITKAPNTQEVRSSLNTILENIGMKEILYPDDPWRGRVADTATANGYKLSAEVTNTETPTLFNVKLKVHTDEFERDRGGTVRFLLHPTFGSEARTAAFDANGDAVLDLIAYGVFTVGAITETGTLLELNLAEAVTPVTAGFLQR